MALKTLLVFTTIPLLITSKDADITCKRVHKAWHLTPEHEKNQFISALHQLNDEGKLARFSTTHHHITDSEQSHYTAAFFAWHRYFIWEFENQVRELGPEYKCFATPYWDITHDSGELHKSYIFRSGIGGCGDINNDLCVDTQNDGAWSRENYPLVHVCHDNEDNTDTLQNGCCLKRRGTGHGADVSGTASYVHFIKYYNNYGSQNGFRQTTFYKYHGEAHGYIGGSLDDYTQMISRYSPEDPTFWMLHTWLDYIFEAWKNCWGYHLIDGQDLDQHLDAYNPYPINQPGTPNIGLDTILKYIPMDDVEWWSGDTVNPTPRKMWNAKDWSIEFERGTFIRNSHLTALCDYDWDTQVLSKNSDTTQDLIALQIDDKTDVEKYETKVWNKLHAMMRMEDNDKGQYTEYDYIQTWDAKTCNYQRQRLGKSPCFIPNEYEKCSENDINQKNEITINELLSKENVSGNECLEDVRNYMYGYAKSMGLLYELCMGIFDKYHVCQIPNIDIMIDQDDKGYYAKLAAIKQRMENEEEKSISAAIIDDFDENDAFYHYPGFNMFIYVIIGVIMIGFVFVVSIKHCCDTKMEYDSNGNVIKPKSASKAKVYGSFYQMV